MKKITRSITFASFPLKLSPHSSEGHIISIWMPFRAITVPLRTFEDVS
jgi:hypothetical protein